MKWLGSLLLLGACASGVSQTVGPEGATLVSADGFAALTIPAGAVVDPTSITLASLDDVHPRLASSVYAITPDGLELAVPATLEIRVLGEIDSAALVRWTSPTVEIVVGSIWSRESRRARAPVEVLSAFGAFTLDREEPPVSCCDGGPPFQTFDAGFVNGRCGPDGLGCVDAGFANPDTFNPG